MRFVRVPRQARRLAYFSGLACAVALSTPSVWAQDSATETEATVPADAGKAEAKPPTPERDDAHDEAAVASATSAPATAAPSSTSARDSGGSPPVSAYVLGGIGGALLVTGSIFGVVALNKNNELEEKCPDSKCSPANAEAGRELEDERNTAVTVANIGIMGGVVSLGIATYLFFRPSRSERTEASRIEVTPILGPEGAVLVGKARF